MRPVEIPPVRRLFVPGGPQYLLWEADLKRADAQIVGKESNDNELLKAFRDNIDIYVESARWLYSTSSISSDQRQWCKNATHACLTEDHEVLTRSGWVSITGKPSEIMCWESGHLKFGKVSHWYDKIETVRLLEWNENSFSQKVTNYHKMPYRISGRKPVWCHTLAELIPSSARLPKSGMYEGGTAKVTPLEARLWCAIHADATKGEKLWKFHLKKERKIERLHKLLDDLSIKYTYNVLKDDTTMTSFEKIPIEPWLGLYVLDWSQNALNSYVNEAPHWDGIRYDSFHYLYGTQHRRVFVTGKKDQAEWFALMVHLTNRASIIKEVTRAYEISISNRPLFRKTNPITTLETVRVICPTTPTGFFMVRRNNVISITGNCNYGCKAATLAKTLHTTETRADEYIRRWFTLHPGIEEWHIRTDHELRRSRTVRNVYGFRRYYTDRFDNLLPQALAWQCSSAVSVTINRGLKHVFGPSYNLGEDKEVDPWSGHPYEPLLGVELLMQIHDSGLGRIRISDADKLLPQIIERMEVEVPYPEPLIIPVTLKVSTESWGDVKEWKAVV